MHSRLLTTIRMTNIDIRMKKEDIKEMDFSFVSSFFLAG